MRLSRSSCALRYTFFTGSWVVPVPTVVNVSWPFEISEMSSNIGCDGCCEGSSVMVGRRNLPATTMMPMMLLWAFEIFLHEYLYASVSCYVCYHKGYYFVQLQYRSSVSCTISLAPFLCKRRFCLFVGWLFVSCKRLPNPKFQSDEYESRRTIGAPIMGQSDPMKAEEDGP